MADAISPRRHQCVGHWAVALRLLTTGAAASNAGPGSARQVRVSGY